MVTSFFLVGQNSFTLDKSATKIEGSSNVHDWVSDATKVSASADLLIENNELVSIQSLKVTFPAKGILSTKGSIMDSKTWTALKADAYPNITYELQKVNSITKVGIYSKLNTTGKLTIAGVSKIVNIDVKAYVITNGNIQFLGEKAMQMTDFKIDPPTALFGTMTTGNDIKIKIDVTMKQTASGYSTMK